MERRFLFGNQEEMGTDEDVKRELEECDLAEQQAAKEEQERAELENEEKQMQKRGTKGKGFIRFDDA